MVDATPAPTQPVVLSLALAQLVPSPTNPRTFFDEARLDELAASMQTVGVLQPLVVRPAKPSPQLKGGVFYEIVAGERRFRAARRAKLENVPVVVRELTDLQVLETQLIENAQRDDIHAIDNAEAFARLQKLDGSYNAKVIAAKIGKSERYVQNVLHYAVLVSTVKEAFRANQINAGHADVIARLKPADQERALKACFHNLYGEDKERGCISVRQLDHWIKGNIRLEVEPQNPELKGLPELQKAIATPQAAKALLQVHRQYGETVKDALPPNAYKVVDGPKNRCADSERAVMVLGDQRGELVDICRARTTCKKHWKYEIEEQTRRRASGSTESGYKKSASEIARERRQRTWSKVRKVAVAEAVKRTPNKLTPGVLKVLAYGAMRFHYNGKAMTLPQVVEEIAKYACYMQESTFTTRIAKPLGINMAALFKAAEAPKKKKPLGAPAPKKRKAGKKR